MITIMVKPEVNPEQNIPLLARRVDELRMQLSQVDPTSLAQKAGAIYQPQSPQYGELLMHLWGEEIGISFPDFFMRFKPEDKTPNIAQQALILYYLHTADGTPSYNRWISFAELPDGRFYHRAFQGYTGQELKRTFKDDKDAFIQAARQIEGGEVALGDAAFTFRALPRVNLLVVMWLGDEEMPSNYQILFDASVSHYLPTDACAIAGSMLTRRLIKAAHLSGNYRK